MDELSSHLGKIGAQKDQIHDFHLQPSANQIDLKSNEEEEDALQNNINPFVDLNSSAQISAKNSQNDTSMTTEQARSIDFETLPTVLKPLEKKDN